MLFGVKIGRQANLGGDNVLFSSFLRNTRDHYTLHTCQDLRIVAK